MRKFLVLAAVLLCSTAAVYITSCSSQDSKTTADDAQSDSLNKVLARGEYLFNHAAGCLDCHSKRDFSKYSGPVVPGTEGGGGDVFDQKYGLPGVFYGRNITPDSLTGVGNWTDDELLRALTQGISKNGDTLFPLMPFANYNRMAKDDLMSIIAYMRTLKPINNAVPARQVMIPMAAFYPAAILQPGIDGNVRPPETDLVSYGEYVIHIADCATCHTPVTAQGFDRSRAYAGGYTFDLGTHKVVSANITPDSLTGIGTWTEEMFLQKFIRYRDPAAYNVDSAAHNTIMPLSVMAGMTDHDLRAIYAYLRTLKPIVNKVEKFPN